MLLIDRRRPRPNGPPAPAPTSTMDIERILRWAADEVRAERRFAWYRSRCPSRFIATCTPSEN